jgi:urease alpha subunit
LRYLTAEETGMAERFDLLVRGGVCLTPMGRVEADIGVRDGRIAAIGALAGDAAGAADISASPGTSTRKTSRAARGPRCSAG